MGCAMVLVGGYRTQALKTGMNLRRASLSWRGSIPPELVSRSCVCCTALRNLLVATFAMSPGRQQIPYDCVNAARFEPTTGHVEWQRVASVDVSKVEREGDLQTLRQFLPEVAVGMVRGKFVALEKGTPSNHYDAAFSASFTPCMCRSLRLVPESAHGGALGHFRSSSASTLTCLAQVDEDDFDANPGLVNAFRLAQLQTQYVLHCSQVIERYFT